MLGVMQGGAEYSPKKSFFPTVSRSYIWMWTLHHWTAVKR